MPEAARTTPRCPRAEERPAAEEPIARATAVRWLVTACAAFGAGLWTYLENASWSRQVEVQLGGSGQPWSRVAAVRADVGWDFLLIAGYTVAAVCLGHLARALFCSPEGKSVARAAIPLGLVVALADVIENGALLLAVWSDARWLLGVMTTAAVVKWAVAPVAAAIALTAFVVVLARLFAHTEERLQRRPRVTVRPPDPLDGDPPVPVKEASLGSQAARWRRGYAVPDLTCPTPAQTQEVLRRRGPVSGFCLSGGGIRSASVALGALQSLRPELLRARYLVAVSGGGYTAGALQLALVPAVTEAHWPDGELSATPADVYGPGSVEEDQLRRHVRYLAGSPAQLLGALGVTARVLLLSLAVLFAPAIVLGALLGLYYRAIPLASLEGAGSDGWQAPGIPAGTWGALVTLAAVALLVYLGGLGLSLSKRLSPPASLRLAGTSRHVASAICLVGLLVAVIGVALPWLIALADGLLGAAARQDSTVPPEVAGPVLGVLVTYVAALVSLLRRKKVVSRTRRSFTSKGDKGKATIGAVPGGALQLILVIVTLVLLAAAWLVLAAGIAAVASTAQFDSLFWRIVACIAVLWALVGGLLDQTSLSLHPFYRRRLAWTFATRRVTRRSDRRVTAQPYCYDEATLLPSYGARVAGFPEVVFAAAANLTGEQRAPLNATTFTFSSRWLGGPDVGYAYTPHVLAAVRPAFCRDLTVQAAVAISGAAFASAMGRAGRWYSTLLAVSGLRLGSWLPNPAFLAGWSEVRLRTEFWTRPGLPSIRRLSYLLREVLDSHRFQDRLLQITDGGHYENLGLVEVLRRRCTAIYCIDASGDLPPTAGTLEQAVKLAWAELGVRVALTEDVWKLVPGSAAPLKPDEPLAALSARLSARNVTTAIVCYPPESDLPDELRHGLLVIGKALLTRDMSYDLLSYAARHAVFPHDSTGDQFFKDETFTAYAALGRHTGEAARRVSRDALHGLPSVCPMCGSPLAGRELVAALLDQQVAPAWTPSAPRPDGRPRMTAAGSAH